ncbi:unnamed protein product [Strongylus vulgaris]|uniref:Uncharacterized protein n=1 Tax=Strongylus vulgaris TaxID=40348 RepID=A0A3P7JQR9_STRVU|nr:unnamed protein product [Strongylus vulgaris]
MVRRVRNRYVPGFHTWNPPGPNRNISEVHQPNQNPPVDIPFAQDGEHVGRQDPINHDQPRRSSCNQRKRATSSGSSDLEDTDGGGSESDSDHRTPKMKRSERDAEKRKSTPDQPRDDEKPHRPRRKKKRSERDDKTVVEDYKDLH